MTEAPRVLHFSAFIIYAMQRKFHVKFFYPLADVDNKLFAVALTTSSQEKGYERWATPGHRVL